MSTILLIVTALIIFSLVGGGLSFAPWVPTRKRDFERIHKFIAVKPGETLYELGSGDGRVCHYLAKKNPQSQVVGIEISPLLFAIAKVRLFLSPQPNLRLKCGSLYSLDLSGADVFYTFVMNETLSKLCKQLASQKKKPIRLISYAFHVPKAIAARYSGKKGKEIILYEYIL